MSHDRYPKDIVLTAEDLADCGWKEILADVEHKSYYSMHSAFSDAAKAAINEDRKVQGKILWLLADACSIVLSPDNHNEPFKPLWQLNGRRSILPDDLSEANVAFFAQIADKIDDPWLMARLADLVWLVKSPRDVNFALVAIDSYRSIPLEPETWSKDILDCWQRAICLARMIGAGAGDRLLKMEASIIEIFQSITSQDGFFVLGLSNLLRENSLGREHALEIAKKLESIALESNGQASHIIVREYFRASSGWFKSAKEDAKSIEMTVAEAENWVTEATNRISSDQPSHMVAAGFYEKAIQIYRTIPKAMRSEYRVDERLADLRIRLNEAGEKSLDEMRVISSPGVDISRLIEIARNSVRGKPLAEALNVFVNLGSGINTKEMRKRAIERINEFPLQAIFPGVVMNRDGRVIAKRPGISPNTELYNDAEPDENEMTTHYMMVQEYCLHIDIAVRGYIRPAQEILLLEHHLRETDFVDLAGQSPIVPIGREQLFGKALIAGYSQDFATALHILVPQIENLVRFHLKQAQVKTRNLDSGGIETENSLNTLIDLSESKEIFGENLCFEIKALFCDPIGPNLRNELAHGLLDDNAFQSSYAIYAWWLGIKLVFNTFWNRLRNNTENEE